MRILSWNINGLKRKITDADFIDYISEYSIIVFLNQAWLSNKETLNFEILGFCCEHLPGNKARNTVKGRFSRGITLYYKNELKNYIYIGLNSIYY